MEYEARPEGIVRKWRPSLALIIFATLSLVLLLPGLGWIVFEILSQSLGASVGLIMAIGFVVSITALLGYVLWRVLMRPIQQLVESSRNVALDVNVALDPIDHYGTAELRRLGQAMLEMSATLQAHAERQKTYTDHVTHELKSPLTALTGAAELLQDENVPQNFRDDLCSEILSASHRMTHLLDELRNYGIVLSEKKLAGESKVSVLEAVQRPDVFVFGNPKIPLDPSSANAVLTQFISNAFEHGATRVDVISAGPKVLICDDGEGIPPAHRSKVCDPFFTTKRNRGGTGLGLPIAAKLLDHGGFKVELWRKSGGTVFELCPK